MTTFPVFGVASSGVTVYRKWLDAVSDNISNINTVRPTDEEAFRARYVCPVHRARAGHRRRHRRRHPLGSAEGRMVYQPDHPTPTPTATSVCPTSTWAAR